MELLPASVIYPKSTVMIVSKISLATYASAIFLLASCAIKPVTSEYNLVEIDQEEITLDELGDGKVLLYYEGNTFLVAKRAQYRLNLWLDDKAVAHLWPREYVVVDLEEGNYQLRVQRGDNLTSVMSRHDLKIDNTTKVVGVAPIFVTNVLLPKDELPRRFDRVFLR